MFAPAHPARRCAATTTAGSRTRRPRTGSTVDGHPVLRDDDPEGREIDWCPNRGANIKPCGKTLRGRGRLLRRSSGSMGGKRWCSPTSRARPTAPRPAPCATGCATPGSASSWWRPEWPRRAGGRSASPTPGSVSIGTGRRARRRRPPAALATVEGDDAVRQAILLLLTTRPGERVMRRTYGSLLHRLVFAPNDDTTAGLAIHYVRQALGPLGAPGRGARRRRRRRPRRPRAARRRRCATG